jgi:hypothetical protein|tara:strand:+ start:532 stop:738 length:207 start_codon:yes stop_codon:yes gene_type:complete
MIKIWKRALKELDIWDIGLIKFSSAVFVLFVITIWPAAMTWVHSVNPWYFFVAFVIFVARPFYRAYIK